MSLNYCIKKASELPCKKRHSRHYAVLVNKKGHIVAESANSYSCTHTKQFYYAKRAGRPEAISLHAELACLLKDRNKKGVKLYVARVNSVGNPCYSAPCEICQLAISEHSNIKSVEYTT